MKPAAPLALSLLFILTGAPVVPAAPVSLEAVRHPCSLRKVCEELSRRFDAKVYPDASLADLRVVWQFQGDVSLETTLARLAELTDSHVVKRPSQDRRPRFALERSIGTTRLEAEWRVTAIRRTIDELLRAADAHERGRLDPDSLSRGLRGYVRMGRVPLWKLLRRLTPPEMEALLDGKKIRFPPGSLSDAEVRSVIAQRFHPNDPDYSPEAQQRMIDRAVEDVRRDGLGLSLDFNADSVHGRPILKLDIGWGFGTSGSTALCAFDDEELGLPLTRTNPYRLLAGRRPAPPDLPAALQRRLERALVAPIGRDWEALVRELARAARLDILSDAYLSRSASRLYGPPGQKEVLVPAGTSVAEALDRVCRRFGYLWWEKDGCVYTRARAWVWDTAYEVPDRFLETWTAAGRARRVGAAEFRLLAFLSPLQWNGIGRLARTRVEGIGGPGSVAARPYLQFFQQLAPRQQALLLGPGLPVSSRQAAAMRGLIGLPPQDTPPQPYLFRFRPSVEFEPKASPPMYKFVVQLSQTKIGGKKDEWPFGFRLPVLPDPFAP